MTVFPEKVPDAEQLRPTEAQVLLVGYLRYMVERIEHHALVTERRADQAEKALRDLQSRLPLQRTSAPDQATEGSVGQLAVCDGDVYVCTAIESDENGEVTYTWKSL